MAFGVFTAMFNVEGNADAQLRRIQATTSQLSAQAIQASTSVSRLAVSLDQALLNLLENDQALGRMTDQQFNAAAAAEKLHQQMSRLALTGNITSSQLLRLSNTAALLGQRIGPELQTKLRATSLELRNLANQSQLTNFQVQNTGRRFQFMGDVSDQTALTMRRVSASAQGLMLSMAALEKNIIGVVFSLIFMQFSGFLKLSLAMAAMTAVAGGAIKIFQSFLARRKETEQMANAINTLSRNILGYEIAVDRAQQITEDLGLTNIKGFETSIVRAMTALTDEVIPVTGKNIRTFVELLLVEMDRTGKGAEESADAIMSQFIRIADGTDIPKGGFEELRKRALFALSRLSKDGAISARGVIAALEDMGFTVAEVNEIYNDLLDVPALFGTTEEAVRSATRGTETLEETLQALMDAGILTADIIAQRFGTTAEELSRGSDIVEEEFLETFELIQEEAEPTAQAVAKITDEVRNLLDHIRTLNEVGFASGALFGGATVRGTARPTQTTTTGHFPGAGTRGDERESPIVPQEPLPPPPFGPFGGPGFPSSTAPDVTVNVDVHDNQTSDPEELASVVVDKIERSVRTAVFHPLM